jgi:hypothetical protein
MSLSPEISQIQIACSAPAPPAKFLPSAAPSAQPIFSAASSDSPFLFSLTPVPAPVLIPPSTATTSSQPPAVSACLVQNPEVMLSSFSFRENQSLLNSPPSYTKIPDSVSDDVKTLLQKFPSILRTGDVKPTPNHGVEHHIHTGCQPPVLAKSRRLDPEKLQIAKAEFEKVRICWHCSQVKITMGFPFAHGTQKRWIMAALWRLPPFKFGDNPRQVSFTKHARPFQWSTRLHNFFKN